MWMFMVNTNTTLKSDERLLLVPTWIWIVCLLRYCLLTYCIGTDVLAHFIDGKHPMLVLMPPPLPLPPSLHYHRNRHDKVLYSSQAKFHHATPKPIKTIAKHLITNFTGIQQWQTKKKLWCINFISSGCDRMCGWMQQKKNKVEWVIQNVSWKLAIFHTQARVYIIEYHFF